MPNYRIRLMNAGAGSKKVNSTIIVPLKDIGEAETRAKDEVLRKSVIDYLPDLITWYMKPGLMLVL